MRSCWLLRNLSQLARSNPPHKEPVPAKDTFVSRLYGSFVLRSPVFPLDQFQAETVVQPVPGILQVVLQDPLDLFQALQKAAAADIQRLGRVHNGHFVAQIHIQSADIFRPPARVLVHAASSGSSRDLGVLSFFAVDISTVAMYTGIGNRTAVRFGRIDRGLFICRRGKVSFLHFYILL